MTTVPAHQIAADLLSAANYLDTFGWERGTFGAIGEPCCADGATIAAVGIDTKDPRSGTDEQSDRAEAAERALADLIDGEPGSFAARRIWIWNDLSPTREVVTVAMRAAAEAVFPTDPPGRAPGGSTETGLAYMEASARFDGHGAARTDGQPS